MKVVRLYTDSRTEPLGVCEGRPGFSWNVETDVQGWRQKAYRIKAAESKKALDDEGGLAWDSGIV